MESSLLLIALPILLCIALVLLAFKVVLAWSEKEIARQAETRFHAVQEIVNQGRIPTSWTRSFEQRVNRIRQSGGSTVEVERVRRLAKRHCLRQLDATIRFMSQGRFYDTPESRSIVLETLQAQRERCMADDWQEVIR